VEAGRKKVRAKIPLKGKKGERGGKTKSVQASYNEDGSGRGKKSGQGRGRKLKRQGGGRQRYFMPRMGTQRREWNRIKKTCRKGP